MAVLAILFSCLVGYILFLKRNFSWDAIPWFGLLMLTIFIIASIMLLSQAWSIFFQPMKNLLIFSRFNLQISQGRFSKSKFIPLEEIEKLLLNSDKEYDSEFEKFAHHINFELELKNRSRELIHVFNPSKLIAKNEYELVKSLFEDAETVAKVVSQKTGIRLKIIKG
jgi:hypothetical protein